MDETTRGAIGGALAGALAALTTFRTTLALLRYRVDALEKARDGEGRRIDELQRTTGNVLRKLQMHRADDRRSTTPTQEEDAQ